MIRSKLSTIVSVLSLLVAVGGILTLFSVRRPTLTGNSRLSATSYHDDDATLSQVPLAIDPAMVAYHQTGQVPVDFKKVTALAVDAEDRIYVAGDKSLYRFSPQGALELRIALSAEPTCLAVANRQHMVAGRIYVGFVDHLEMYDAEGAAVGVLGQGLGEKARCTSISTSEDYVFIADAGQERGSAI